MTTGNAWLHGSRQALVLLRDETDRAKRRQIDLDVEDFLQHFLPRPPPELGDFDESLLQSPFFSPEGNRGEKP